MKNVLKVIIVLLVTIQTANAQFFKKLKDKVEDSAERAIERKANEKIDRTTEAAVDTIFEFPKKIKMGKKKNSKKDTTMSGTDSEDLLSNEMDMMKGMGTANFETSYTFPVTATIEVEDSNANLKKMTMKQGYGKEALITEFETNGDPMIVDMKNQSAVMLNINAGTAQVMSLKWMEQMLGNSSDAEAESFFTAPKVSKTGKTKIMNGYLCNEYNISFDEGKINAWYAPDVKFDYQDYLRGMAKMFSGKKEENPMQLLNTDYGYVMEMTFYDNANKKQNSIKVIDITENVRMINMDVFEIQKI